MPLNLHLNVKDDKSALPRTQSPTKNTSANVLSASGGFGRKKFNQHGTDNALNNTRSSWHNASRGRGDATDLFSSSFGSNFYGGNQSSVNPSANNSPTPGFLFRGVVSNQKKLKNILNITNSSQGFGAGNVSRNAASSSQQRPQQAPVATTFEVFLMCRKPLFLKGPK
jgi:hypothetical protein